MATEKTAPLPENHEPIAGESGFEPSKVDKQERKLGRYELIYEIGHGGMANVFLARARGPAGFQKWFAIKRVHDQLAKNDDFVNMFLDEARIAAAIQHPNVAQVFDLGEADGRYFLAMEYMHGEPLTALATQFSQKAGHMPAQLAAYVIARAADGLHHAHEATDAQGRSMNLVHRDVSPHNIFVTYDGQVKVMDFGVAKAAGRITHTQTGVVKGKLAYASPEQLRGAELDRRSDVFALGTVLWEIATGRRLFRGATDAETLHRIHSGYRLPPGSFVEGFPPGLERIINKALAHDVDQRYETAAQLSRDLDRFILGGEVPADSSELAGAMREHFVAQIAAKEAILHHDPSSEVGDLPITIEHVDEPSVSRMQRREVPSVEREEPAPIQAKRSSAIAWGIAILVLLIIGGGLAGWQLGTPSTSRVRIDTSPGGATAELDGDAIPGRSPLLVEDVIEGDHRLVLRLDGHDDFEADFEAGGGRVELHYTLSPTAPVEPETPIAEPTPDPPPPVEPPDEPVANTEPVPSGRRSSSRRRASQANAEPAVLTLITRPWARVWINGQDSGNTPLFRRSVPSGRLRLRLQPEGAGPIREITLRAAPGESVSRNLDLTQ